MKALRKPLSLLMAMLMCLSVFAGTGVTAFAATTEEVGTITFTRVYDSNGNGIFYNSSAVINGYTAGGTNHVKYRMYVDGETAYCIEPGVPLKTGNTLQKDSSETWNALSNSQKKAVGLALLYGRQGNRANLPGNDDEQWLATQTLVWEFVTGCRNSTGSFEQVDTKVYSLHFGENQPNNGARAVYDQIVAFMQRHNTVPSFMNGGSIDLDYQDGGYTKTLTDTNGVLSEYDFASSDSSVVLTKSGNKLTIRADHAISGSVRITAARNNIPTVSESARMIAYGDPSLQDVVTGVEKAGSVTAYLEVGTPTGNMKLIKTSEDGKVEGISFTITGEGYSATKTTNSAGEIDISDLNPGVYTVTEQSIEKYEPQAIQRVTIVGGQTATVNFNNKLKRGSLEVTKTSEDGLVEGMTFHLYGTSLSGLPVDEYAVTDGNGVARFENVLIGSGYVLEEENTPVRYVVPDSQTAAIEWNKVTRKSVDNILKKFRVTVTKSDVETGAPQGDGSLAGATYGLYKGETLVSSFTTDQNGQFTTGYYVCDSDWTVREISPSEGYLLDSTIHKVGAEPELYTIELNDTANDVTEQIIKGDIAIIKHTDDGETQIETPEDGAEFEVFLKAAGSYENARESERDVLVCDENGFAQSKKLPYGTYIVHQTKGWEGRELMDDFEVYIAQDGQTYRYLINNANFASFIKVVKVDAETGVTIPYAGAGFQIYRPDGSKVEMTFTYPTPTTIDTFYTNSEGCLVTPEKLEYGTGYALVEVQAPYGYVLDSTPVAFDVTEDNSSEEGGITVIEVTKPNMPQKGIIKVSKTGEVLSSVVESEGVFQPVYAAAGLPDAVFEITALEDVYTLDGTLRYAAGEVVDTITTGEDGTAQSQPLYLGKFQVKEIQFPHGMVDTGENITNVELVYAGQEVEITETSASFYNQRQKALVTLDKVLEQDETFGIGMNGEISAVTFGLYAQEDITAADGSVIPADGLLEIVSVGANGQAVCSTDLPFGGFYLKELSTDSHYLLNGETFPFTFEYGGPAVAVVEISANDGEAIANELVRGEIQGLKTDENGTGLSDAVIGLFQSDETEFTAENALATATSAEDGSFSFAGIPYGNWVLKELESPEGFLLSDEIIPVTVKEDGQIVEISLTNEHIYGDLRLTKVDKDYPDNKLTGAEFEVYRDTNGNKELDEGDELMGKLEETSTGIYEMSHILYGGVFVKESKAPEGFLLDENSYYVEIAEHGKIYEVENEAGKGFVNAAQTGSLRIEKTSSDGKVEGFSFRVTGANGYDQTFKTDSTGKIEIQGLRVGDYTVSEVLDGASANYVLPADKTVTIFADKTTVAQMHNELRDTPKTGDDSKPWLWAALMGVSAAGAAALGVAAYVGKRKKGKNTAE